MPILTKEVQQQLRQLAMKMPIVMVNSHEDHIMTKEELEEFGYVDADQLPDGRYVYKYPVQMSMNHYRGLKKGWLKNGFEGCSAYIDRINKI